MSPVISNSEEPSQSIDINEAKDAAKSTFEKIFSDIKKSSAAKQIAVGATSGWLTGYLAMKVGKAAACAVGGGIILLEIAHQKGYIKVNWDKVTKQLDKVSDQVEESISGEKSSISKRLERFAERKVDKAEEVVKKAQKKVKRWYSPNDEYYRVQELHLFVVSFAVGTSLGVIMS